MNQWTIDRVILAKSRLDIFDWIGGLMTGDPGSWIVLGLVLACIGFFAVYQKVTGTSFVKCRSERRKARNRRKVVLWETRR